MITVGELRKVFSEKLERTGSFDAAFTKAVWVAFQDGMKEGLQEARDMGTAVTRLEVIDQDGRSYVNNRVTSVELSMQDENRTLKLFINKAT